MKIKLKYWAFGLISMLLISIVHLFVSGGQYVHTKKDFLVNGGYKVGTISVEEIHHLPERLSASLDGVGDQVYSDRDTFVSNWISADVPFHAIGISWKEKLAEGQDIELFVRTREANGSNSEWMRIEKDGDSQSDDEVDGIYIDGKRKYYSFLQTAWSTNIQYKIEFATDDTNISPEISDIEFTYIDSTGFNPASIELPADELVASLQILPRGAHVKVISRSEWGANEDLRVFKGLGKPKQIEVNEEISSNYGSEIQLSKEVTRNDDNKLLTWPLQYPATDIKAIFVHHTASQEDAMEDSYAAMRAIYYYHAITRGWGDIGYNYLVGADGIVFEGRFGGDKVVGAHTANFNVGTIGIAMIGNYEEYEVNGVAIEGLIKILTQLSEKFQLDPTAITKLRGKNTNAISGHRDAGHTACPGEHVYEKLPSIRQLVKNELQNRGEYNGAVQSVKAANGIDFDDIDSRNIIILGPEEMKTASIRLRNTGSKAWTRNTTLVYRNGEHNIAGFPETVANLKEVSVGHGEIGTFDITMRGSFLSGLKNYYLYVGIGKDISERQLLLPVYMEPANLTFKLVQIDKNPKLKLSKNESTKVTFTIQNNGNVTWNEYNVVLQSITQNSIFTDGHMITRSEVKPGQKAVFEASFKAGNTSGQVVEKIKLVLTDSNGNKVLSKTSQEFNFMVAGVNTLKAGEKILLVGSSENHILKPGEKVRAWIEVENNTNEVWTRAGVERVFVAMLKAPSIKASNLLMQKGQINPGETTKISFDLTAPSKEGSYFVNFIFRHKDLRLTKNQMRFDFKVSKDASGIVVEPRSVSLDNSNAAENLGDKIRVALSFAGNPMITSDSNLRVFDSNGKDLNNGIPINGGEKIKVSYADGKYTVYLGSKKVTTDKYIRIGSDNGILEITNFSNPPAWNQSLNDNKYRGILEVRYVDEKLMVINELPLEQYLYGIAEVSNTDHNEKIKTLMVVARTYAKYYMDRRGTANAKFPGKPYDLDSSPDVSQKYLGYGLETRSPKIVVGVDATSGEVVTYNGKIVKTPYFNATDGTATKSAQEVWGWKDTPYLVSVPDPLCESKSFSGHGVGLSGCGATAAAERGYSYKEIIKYYYKDVEIKDSY